ncbi:DsrE family protein [Rhodopseudomonas telluris]|uniref:Uncharacterized protein n=1 Tax=Rhodopseudomonas telluris TaxID=644215 RepID=A0ABV6EWI5_9BRAD
MRSIPFIALSTLVASAMLPLLDQPTSAKDGCHGCTIPAGSQNKSMAGSVDIAVPGPRLHAETATKSKPQQRSERAKEPTAIAHRLVLQVNSNDAAAMNLALNNATNVADYYKSRGDKVQIEIVTFGPGLHMLRNDTSPVKTRIEEMALGLPEVSFKACGNTRDKMSKAEDKEIPILSQARIVDSGVVRVMELQENGWSYVKP